MSQVPSPNPDYLPTVIGTARLVIQAEMADLEDEAVRLIKHVGAASRTEISPAQLRILRLLKRAYALGGRNEWIRAHEVKPPKT